MICQIKDLRLIDCKTKGQTKSKWFFQTDVSSKKLTKFDFTTMIPQVDLFLYVFWKKLETPKRHFDWPLVPLAPSGKHRVWWFKFSYFNFCAVPAYLPGSQEPSLIILGIFATSFLLILYLEESQNTYLKKKKIVKC